MAESKDNKRPTSVEQKIDVVDYLKQHANEVHKPVKKRFRTRMVFADYTDELWSCDLSDVPSYTREAKGYRYYLVCVDVFTRYLFAEAMKGKTDKDCVKAFDAITQDEKRWPRIIWFDREGGVRSDLFTDWRKKQNPPIAIRWAEGPHKSAIAERMVRTIKNWMMKQLTEENHHNWPTILQDLVLRYNNKVHPKLGMTPQQAFDNPVKTAQVWDKLKRAELKDTKPEPYRPFSKRKPTFKVGDKVRIARDKGVFGKESDKSWSEEIYTITQVDDSIVPKLYTLKDYRDEPVSGKFYAEQIQKAKYPDVYLIDKVIKSRTVDGRKEHFVSFIGHSERFNRWMPASSISRLNGKI
jgi:hypothetical protein